MTANGFGSQAQLMPASGRGNALPAHSGSIGPMQTNPLKEPSHLALELANGTKDAWLIAHSQNLRAPLSAMASMLGSMELKHQRASVRPLYETPSEFDEAAFQHVQSNFQGLVRFFNELSDLTGQRPLQFESSPPPVTETSVAASINSANPRS